MAPTDPEIITTADRVKLLAVYKRLCPNDQLAIDDPRAPIIAAEIFDVGRAATAEEAFEVVRWWAEPQGWTEAFVDSVRRGVRRMKLELPLQSA